ncbi:hypothetical protein GALL_504000 [mine drainage metagenome]|uniref:Uncharacterized protein n=1 Tax=mine drainage metagenome TaxID=410659 RepID=A0A1J5PKC1_9ZZZZ
MQVHALFGVAQHVHALVGIELIGHVLIAQSEFEQLVAVAPRQPQRVVAHVVGGGPDDIAPQGVAGAAGGRGCPEIAAGGIVVGLGVAAVVVDGERRGAVIGIQSYIAGIAVVAPAGADLAAGDGLTRCSESRRLGVDDNGATDRIAAHRDGRHAGVDGDG